MGIFVFVVLFCISLGILFLGKRICLENHANLFGIYWLVNIGVALVLFNFTYDWKWWGLCYLLACVNTFGISFLYMGYGVIQKKKKIYPFLQTSQKLKGLLWFGFAASISFVLITIAANGFSPAKLTSLEGLFESGTYFSEGRYGYQVELQVPLIGQICLTLTYASFILSGYVYRLRLAPKYLCFLSFLPMMFDSMVTSGKTGVVSGMMLWISGYLVAKNYDFVPTKSKKSKLSIILLVIIIFVVFYGSFYVRYGGTSDMRSIWYRIITYGIGHVPCYDDWFNEFSVNLLGYSHGQQTFMMFFGHIQPDALAKVYISPFFFTRFSWTNVITLFAYVLMDFGLLGGLFFFTIFGGCMALAYRLFLSTGSGFAQAFLGLGYYIILYSFLVSPMRYLSIVGAFFLFGMYLGFVKKRIVMD